MTVILGALVAGGASAAQTAVADAYAGLKALISRKFGSAQPGLDQVLEQHAGDPDLYRLVAQRVLRDVGADRDQEVVDTATALLEQAEAATPGLTGGLVGQINAQGGRIVVVGRDMHGDIRMDG